MDAPAVLARSNKRPKMRRKSTAGISENEKIRPRCLGVYTKENSPSWGRTDSRRSGGQIRTLCTKLGQDATRGSQRQAVDVMGPSHPGPGESSGVSGGPIIR